MYCYYQSKMIDPNTPFSKLLDSSINAVMILETLRNENQEIIDFKYIYVNSKVSEYLSLSKEIFIGEKFRNLMPASIGNELFEIYKSVIENSSKLDFEYNFKFDDFDTWYQIMASSINDILFISFLDITVKKCNEQKLISSEYLYKLISENTLDFLSIHDLEGNCLFASPSCKVLLGYDPEELVGFNAYDFFHPDDIDSIRRLVHIPLIEKSEESITHELRIIKKDGTSIWVETKSRMLPTESTNIRILTSARSIHERKLVENHVLQLALDYERVFNGTLDAIALIHVDNNNCFKYIKGNKVFHELTGIDLESLPNSSPEKVFGTKYGLIMNQNYLRCIIEGNITLEETIKINGHSYIWLTTLTPISEFDKVQYIVSSSRDVTEQRNAQLELNQYRINLEESNLQLQKALKDSQMAIEVKNDFISNMSHEVRTPLNGILGMTDLLKDSNLDENQLDYVDVIRSSGKILLRIINDILDFSKMEAGRLRLELQKFNIQEIIESSVKLFQEKANKKNIQLSSFIAKEIPNELVGDQGRLLQILLNLIGNAVKFTDQGSIDLIINLIEIDELGLYEIEFSVIDTGIGVANDKLNLLFQPFRQIDSSLTRKYEGTGLGLSICDKLVKLMNGQIGYLPNPKGGSEFWFTTKFQIPKNETIEHDVTDSPDANNNQSMISLSSHNKEPSLLIVEDNPVNQKVASFLLRRLGYHADIALNGSIALDLMQKNSYDLIFMDIQMPVMNGIDATKKIRAMEQELSIPRTTIIAMTANASEESKITFLEAGMDDCISKPIESYKLDSILKKWI